MSNATDEIEAMLALIEDRQIKCPKCGRSDDLYIVYPEFSTRAVGATLTGGLLEHDDNNYFDPPARFNIPQRMIVCGNFKDHDPTYGPPYEGEAPFEWFQYPENTPVQYGVTWADIEVARGLAPPAEE